MNNSMAIPVPENSTKNTVSQTFKKYGNQLLSFIKNRVGKLEDAEDILQDVWYQFSKLSSIDELESISGWLYAVTRNRITDLYRKKKTSSLEDIGIENDEEGFSIKEVLLMDETSHPELAMFKDAFWKALFMALDELPENQRQVFILNEIEDKTLQEIADLQGENLKTIISRKGYAVKYLRKKLEYLYQELNQ